MKTITYAIDQDGYVYSRLGSLIAVPILEYDKIGQGGNFNAPLRFYLEKFNVLAIPGPLYASFRWTKKIPLKIKNQHRKFWGFKPLKA